MKKIALFFTVISLSYCSNDAPTITNDTLATVNARTISKDDFISQAQSVSSTPSINLTSNDGRISVLKDMINEELVFQQALHEKYHLKNLNIKHEVVKEYLKQKFAKDLPAVTDEQIKDFYNKNQSDLDQVRASHILIAFKKDNPKEKKDAYEKIQKIRAEIVSGKIGFPEAAGKYSMDAGSQKTQGDLSYFSRARMVEPFAKVVFNMKKIGEISQVVETEFGYHIIQLTGEMRGFDAYKERIRWKLYQDAMQPKIDAYFKSLLEKSKVKIVNSDLSTLNIHQQ